MLPADVYQLYFSNPTDYSFMRAKVRADYEWQVGDFDIQKPREDIDLLSQLERL